MDEDIVAINNNTRNEKIKNFFVKNKKRLIFIISLIVLLIFGYFIYGDLKERNKIELADRYNKITINLNIQHCYLLYILLVLLCGRNWENLNDAICLWPMAEYRLYTIERLPHYSLGNLENVM